MQVTFPKFTSSDEELNITYQYRCELYQRHVKKTPEGHVITEFLPDVPWSGIYNTISCAASHHFRDGRWLQDTSVLNEYARFWCFAGNPRLYSFPIAHSLYALAEVTGDFSQTVELYPELLRIHREWDDHKTENGMYRQQCGYDGMEFSISGDGIRPTINSYMAADKSALSRIAQHRGLDLEAQELMDESDVLRVQINEQLWNDEIGMFGVISDEGVKQNVREQIGYIPWIYNLVLPGQGRANCFRNLLDPACFLSPYGLRTADASHPEYNKPFHHECLWNGPIWPFATAQTLTAVIQYLHGAKNPVITHEEFMSLLLRYAYSHRDEDGTPWLDENMDPDTGEWLARKILRQWDRDDKERGRHYNHSSFIDLVMTGVCGIDPFEGKRLYIRPLGTSLDFFRVEGIRYHGHTVDMDWDRNKGLRVILDGEREYFREAGSDERMSIEL